LTEPDAQNPASPAHVPEQAGVAPVPPEEDPGVLEEVPPVLAILPLRDMVAFPGTVMPLGVGRPASRHLLDEVMGGSKLIGLVSQKDPAEEEPRADGLYAVGTLARVLKFVRQPDETVSIIVHGGHRFRVRKVLARRPYLKAEVEAAEERPGEGAHFEASVKQLREQARELLELTPKVPEQALAVLMNIEAPGQVADFLAANLNLRTPERQDLLEELDVAKRVRTLLRHVSDQLEIARLQQKIHQDVQSSIDQTQRKMYLREQMKAIQRELGEDPGPGDVLHELREKIEAAAPPEAVLTEAQRELDRLAAIPPASPEYSMITSWLELLAELPWSKRSEGRLDLAEAEAILDRDHFDLEKVKRRLLEFLAVRKLKPGGRSPILCLVGPPGVGKTSLGESVAESMGRRFARLSLGGIRDEAEIRGHRRTYVGAMPGRVIQALRRSEANNPVMMLDEVDKLGADFRGDPASALLEVLDPRQNHAFVDRYLDVPFDLSDIIFICTANYMGHVPPALRDRMEVIEMPGYSERDKAEIARRYLVPRQIEEHGLTPSRCPWRDGAIRKVIEDYTREAGVRELERRIGAVCRAVAAEVARGECQRRTVNERRVRRTLGPETYVRELDIRARVPGVVVGLAYTPVGGEILFVEAARYPGKGELSLTGQIGEVMKESATAAMSLFKSRAGQFGLEPSAFAEWDMHIHVPAGAVPKDGPSAGVAMYAAIASLFTGRPVRSRMGMTGEITLRGRLMPVGGIKEKVLAADRAGIRTILLPAANKKDLEEVDPEVCRKLEFTFVEDVDEMLEHAFRQA